MILVKVSAFLAMYFMTGMAVVLVLSLFIENFWETTTPKDWIMGILFWPVFVCEFIVGFINKYNEK